MEQNVQNWSHTTNSIFNAVLIFSIGTIVVGLLGGLTVVFSMVGAGVVFRVLTWIAEIAVAVGYVLYMIGLGNLRSAVGEKEGVALGQIRTAAILSIVTAILGIFGIPAWINGIINFVAFVMMLVGFNTLKKSAAMPEKARNGFNQLFIAMLLNIIAIGITVILGWIPLVGNIITAIAAILGIIGFVMVITGWAAVKHSPAPIA